jgi:copper chaperone CopZ
MRTSIVVVVAVALMSLASGSFTAAAAAAETKVTMEKTHLCCTACVKGAEKAVSSVAGAAVACDQAAGMITITAADAATAQKAVDALLAAGYTGKTTGAQTKEDSGAPDGKVKSATVSGFHNCCRKCTTSLNDVLKAVPGAKGEVAAKATTVAVTGDFDAKALVKQFNDAGFHVKVQAK